MRRVYCPHSRLLVRVIGIVDDSFLLVFRFVILPRPPLPWDELWFQGINSTFHRFLPCTLLSRAVSVLLPTASAQLCSFFTSRVFTPLTTEITFLSKIPCLSGFESPTPSPELAIGVPLRPRSGGTVPSFPERSLGFSRELNSAHSLYSAHCFFSILQD